MLLGLVIGALVGTLASGRLSDWLLRKGVIGARVMMPAVCYLAAGLVLIPGVVGSSLTPAVWFDIGGAALLMAANPPLDAARLDIMPAGLWGRAESTRTFLRSLGQALAPVAFGGMSSLIAGFVPAQAPVGTRPGHVSSTTGTAIELTFLVMLVTLFAAGVFLIFAHRHYARDVATAAASNQGGPWKPSPTDAYRGRTPPRGAEVPPLD